MKILASDFDNTIYFLDDKKTTQRNIKAIRDFVKQGNIFCIITGRNYSDLKNILNEYDIPYSYLVCEDGAKIFNNMDYCIETVLLERRIIERLIPILEENNCDYYLDDGYNKTNYLEDVVKIVINCTDDKEKNRIISIIKEHVNIHIYASRFHVNIINKSVNKEKALKKLINLEKLDVNLLNVIGDNDNDYEMLKEFNGGVIKKHHKILDELNKPEFDTLAEFIESII